MDLSHYIRDVENFPKEWITFKDITPLLENSEAFNKTVDLFCEKIWDVDKIVWLDARGFLFAWAMCYKLNKPLVIIRKTWKLPSKTITKSYDLEYWSASFDIHVDSIKKWDKVAIVDDLLATWGTAEASAQLIEELGWIVESINFVVNLSFLPWEQKLSKYKLNNLLNY